MWSPLLTKYTHELMRAKQTQTIDI
jgi:hypothetical protein